MNKAINTLSSILWTSLPVVFIGPAYFIIPECELFFDEALGDKKLPRLTEIIVSIPGPTWLIIATLLSALNYYISKKEKNAPMAIFSTIAILLIAGVITIGLFLPIHQNVMVMRESPL